MFRPLACVVVLLFAMPAFADEKPFPKPLKDGEKVKTDGWFGKYVLPTRYPSEIRMGDWNDDTQETWTPRNLMNCTVLEDRDGFVRVHDGRREGWVSKDDMVPAEDAPVYFDKVVKANEKDAFAWQMRGVGWCSKKEYDNAIKDFTEAIRLRPEASALYNLRGIVWFDKKEYGKAIADYTEALKLDPKSAIAIINRGNARYEKKEYDKAIADYTEALKLAPKEAYTHGNRARTFVKLKKYDDAVSGFEKAIELNPKSWMYLYFATFRALCPEAKYRDGKKAVELAKKAVEKAGKDATWHYPDALATAYAEAGDFELAVAEQRKAIEQLKEEKDPDKDDIKKAEERLELYRAKKPYRDE